MDDVIQAQEHGKQVRLVFMHAELLIVVLIFFFVVKQVKPRYHSAHLPHLNARGVTSTTDGP
jgi:hypothetical protein